MKKKTALIPLVLCAVGMTFTACGDRGTGDKSQTSASVTSGSTSNSTTQPKSTQSDSSKNNRPADVDGDGFIEDVVTDISDAARDIIDDVIPGDGSDRSTDKNAR